MQLIIDRIEGTTVLCETPSREIIPLPLDLFSFPIKDGDLINYDGTVPVPLPEETQKRKANLQARFSTLAKKKTP